VTEHEETVGRGPRERVVVDAEYCGCVAQQRRVAVRFGRGQEQEPPGGARQLQDARFVHPRNARL
jgi:hypothetical protein